MYCTEPASTVDQNVFRIIIYLCILSRVLGVFTRESMKNKKSLDACKHLLPIGMGGQRIVLPNSTIQTHAARC